MEKNIVNPIVVLLLGTLIAATTTTVPGAAVTEPTQITLENIVIERNPWLGTPRYPLNMVQATSIPGSGWMKLDRPIPKSPTPVPVGVV